MKAWKQKLAYFTNTMILATCVYMLIFRACFTSEYSWHSTVQLYLAISSCISWCVLVRSVSKRQVFNQCITTALGQGLVASTSVWHCHSIFVLLRCLGGIVIVVLTAIMRKLAARLGAGETTTTQVTHAQMALLGALYANIALMWVFPGFILLQMLEVALFALMVMNGWVHFMRYSLASKKAFGAVSSAASLGSRGTRAVSLKSGLTPRAIKSAKRARKNIGGNMVLCHVFVHMIFIEALLFNPVFEDGSPGQCPFSNELNPRHDGLIDELRLYLNDAIHVIIFATIWHTLVVFKEASKRKGRGELTTKRARKPIREVAVMAVTRIKPKKPGNPPTSPDLAETVNAPPSSDARASSRKELDYPMMLNL